VTTTRPTAIPFVGGCTGSLVGEGVGVGEATVVGVGEATEGVGDAVAVAALLEGGGPA